MKKIYQLIMILLLLIPVIPVSTGIKGQGEHAVSYADITITDTSGGTLYLNTDANGMVSAMVKAGVHSIRVEAFGNKPKTISNIDFSQTTEVDISLDPSPVISGVVTVEGVPASGILLDVGGNWVFTDSQGRYYVPVSADIGDKVEVSAYSLGDTYLLRHYSKTFMVMSHFMGLPSFLTLPIPFGIGFMAPHEPKNVVQKSVQVTLNSMHETLDIDLESSFTISGYVMAGSDPVEGAMVVAISNDVNNPLTSVGLTDEEGHYVISNNIKVGSYNLTVYAIGYSTSYKTIQITGDATVDFTLEVSPILNGMIVSEDGHPISNAYIFLQKEGSGEKLTAFSDNNGEFHIDSGLSVGTWKATYGYIAGSLPIMGNSTIEVHEGVNDVQLTLPVTMMKFEGVIDDPARDNLLESVELTITAQVYMYSLPFTFTIGQEGHFEVYVPKSFNIGGQTLQASSYSVSVKSNYYYPNQAVASNILPSTTYDLGTIEVDAGELVNVIIYVSSSAGNIESPDLYYGFDVYIDDIPYNITIKTNSSIRMPIFILNESQGIIYIQIGGQGGTNGKLTIDIPKSLMQPPFTVELDNVAASHVDIVDRGTYTEIILTYGHSVHDLTIRSTNVVPEFPIMYIGIIVLVAFVLVFLMRKH